MSDDDNLHFNATGATGAAGGTTDDAQNGEDVAVVFRTSSNQRFEGVTYGQLSDASGVSVARLSRMGEDELLALADATLADDEGADADPAGDEADTPVPLDALDDEARETLVEAIAEAIEAGRDVTGLLEEIGELVDLGDVEDAVASRVSGGEATGTNAAGLTANSQILAVQHGLPATWEHLQGVEVPDELVGATLSDEAISAVVNKLHDATAPGARRVTPRGVANSRNRSSAPPDTETGVTLSAFDDGADDDAPDYEDMVGLDPRDEDVTMTRQQAVKAVERAQSRRGDATTERTGTSLEDLDDAGGE